jgi:ketosteroid isomerase-like protein
MSAFGSIADRVEIEGLRGEFTDAGMQRDFDRFASLFTGDAVWRIPHAHVELRGRDAIRSGIEQLLSVWEFAVQNTHPGTIVLDGDTARGRAYVAELGRWSDGTSHLNYAVYHDRYRRTANGWKFVERVYEVYYVDNTPLAGSTAAPPVTERLLARPRRPGASVRNGDAHD